MKANRAAKIDQGNCVALISIIGALNMRYKPKGLETHLELVNDSLIEDDYQAALKALKTAIIRLRLKEFLVRLSKVSQLECYILANALDLVYDILESRVAELEETGETEELPEFLKSQA